MDWKISQYIYHTSYSPIYVCMHVCTYSGDVNIVLEYMDGGSLQDIVDTGGCASESVSINIHKIRLYIYLYINV